MRMRNLWKEDVANHVEELTRPATCPECGKAFEVRFPDDYVFKRTHSGNRDVTEYWCSWHCWKAMKDRREKPELKGERFVAQRLRLFRSVSSQVPSTPDAEPTSRA